MGAPFPCTSADPGVDWLDPSSPLPPPEAGQTGPRGSKDWLALEVRVVRLLLSRGLRCFLITWLLPRPLCSCRCFGCRHCCLQPLAFCCYPEPCCPWLQEVPRPSPRRPRAPPMSPARSLRPLSPAPTRRSPRRSPGGDFSVKRGKGCGGEAPSSLRQPCPSDYIHL
ncbi:protein CutA isoform X2 [Bos mutus]|uniref:protein CutA isoform X2 n=1 Tax=Bos mutus TaxID=72004 RepID=UPI0038B519DF